MTRKQALQYTLSILDSLEQTDEIREIQGKLVEIAAELPFTSWSELTIMDTLKQFAIEHGRQPHTGDLRQKGMPPHPVIKNRFNMNAKEFLSCYFPAKNKSRVPLYSTKTREEWKEIFISDYIALEHKTAVNFNKNRSANTPPWQRVSEMFGIKKWTEWQKYCGFTPPQEDNAPSACPSKKYIVTTKSTIKAEMEALLRRIAAFAESEI